MDDLSAVYATRNDRMRERRSEGLDPNVCYLTTKDVMRHAGISMDQVHYHIRVGHLKEARAPLYKGWKRFHPDEVKRFRIEYLKQDAV